MHHICVQALLRNNYIITLYYVQMKSIQKENMPKYIYGTYYF